VTVFENYVYQKIMIRKDMILQEGIVHGEEISGLCTGR
jgi:hypothetical protein